MATERVVYEGETARLLGAIQKMIDKETEHRLGLGQTRHEAKKTESGFAQMGATAVDQLKNMVLGWASVNGAIGLARSVYSQWVQEMDEAGKKFSKTTTGLVQILSARGELDKLPIIREYLEKKTPAGLTQEEKIKTYGAVADSLPDANWQETLEMASKAMEGKAAGIDPVKMGDILGNLADVIKDKSYDDLSDLATVINKYAPQFGNTEAKALEQWQALQLGPVETGLGYLLASQKADQGGKTAIELFGKLQETKELEPLSRREERRLTEAQRQERAYYQADPAARMQMLTDDQQLVKTLFGAHSGKILALLGNGAEDVRKELLAAQKDNLFESYKELIQADAGASLVQNKDVLNATVEQIKQDKYGMTGATMQETWAAIDKALLDISFLNDPATRGIAKGIYSTERALGPYSGLLNLSNLNATALTNIVGAIDWQAESRKGTAPTPAAPAAPSVGNQYNYPNAQILNFTPGIIPVAQVRPPLAGDMGGTVSD